MTATVARWLALDAAPTLAVPRLAPAAVGALARRRLARILHAAGDTDFYREPLAGAGWGRRGRRDPGAVLAALPPVGKAELRGAGNGILCGGRPHPGWATSSSSGSTGEPFRVYYDPRAWARLKYLVKWRARWLCGTGMTDRIAVLDAVPPARPPEAPGSTRVARISVLQPAAAVAAGLLAHAPDTIYALPSALLEAAAALEAAGARLRVRRVFTSGELLQPSARRAIEAAFGARVFDVYGSSETKEIAWECRAGGMHVNADVVRLEVLDDRGDPVADGVEGELVATLLVNRAMPLLRYRIGDRGSLLPHPCPCGVPFPLLGIVTGRETDMVRLVDGRRVSPYAFTCALERLREIRRYQVTQTGPARVWVRAIAEAAADRPALTARVRRVLRDEVAPFLDADVEYVDRLPTGPRAKFRVVEPLPSGEMS